MTGDVISVARHKLLYTGIWIVRRNSGDMKDSGILKWHMGDDTVLSRLRWKITVWLFIHVLE